jgi:3-carboxy-cis,cis-muconate cycloisomerase
MSLFDNMGTTPALAEIFSDGSLVAAMLRFEVALASAEARVGIIPEAAAEAIAAAAVTEAFDPAEIGRLAHRSGTIAIPLAAQLVARVRTVSPDAAAFVHRGATSQDLTDTAMVLCLTKAGELLSGDHHRLRGGLRRLSDAHADSVMLARTLLQPATPTTFGLKVAGWFGAISRSGTELEQAFEESSVLQFGGASGTLAALGSDGLAVASELARELGLRVADAPWHAHRDRLARLVAACGIYTGTLGKVARDISLLMQHEVAETAEPGGGSSTMPHKRNPAGCAVVLAAATRLPGLVAAFLGGMPQEHERGLGNWHAESATIATAVQTTGGAVAALATVIETLTVDPARMHANIDSTGGLVYAEGAMMLLAPALGRVAAERVIAAALERARSTGQAFVGTLAADADVQRALGPGGLAGLDRPEAYLGVAEHFRRRLLGRA